MAMEKPVILTDLPVLREIVDHGRTGLVCRAADSAHLAATLLQLARNPKLRQDLGRAARQCVIEERSWIRNARTLGDLCVRLNGWPIEKGTDGVPDPSAHGTFPWASGEEPSGEPDRVA